MEEIADSVPVVPESGDNKPGLASRAGRFLLRALGEVVGTILPAVLVAVVINLFVAQATVVRGQSMEPNLQDSQRVIVEKVTYRFLHGPRRGDVVVLRSSEQEDPMIKRVLALPGETVAVHDGRVLVNNRPLVEDWAVGSGGADYPPTLVPPLHVFVLGDNRGHSRDSRSFGPVQVRRILGRAWLVYWPLEQVGLVH